MFIPLCRSNWPRNKKLTLLLIVLSVFSMSESTPLPITWNKVSSKIVWSCIFLAKNYNSSQLINVGSGHEISIKKFANLIKEIVGYNGKIIFDTSKPDGMKRKMLNSEKIKKIGWKPRISLKKGLKLFYKWYLNNQNILRK